MFSESDIKTFNENPFELIGEKWTLVTSGIKNDFNTMTASWGGVGVLWRKNVAFTFIRPQRYTYEFMEKNEFYTLSFFSDQYKKALSICGSVSGRDTDKVTLAGLTPVHNFDTTYFDEARMVLVCKKIYAQDINPECFIDKSIESEYSANDYHRMYVGEIVKVLIQD